MFTITKDQADQIKQVCKLAASKSSIQALENVLIIADQDRLKLTAGDGVVEMTSSIDCDVQSGGRTTVNASKFIAALTACGFECNVLFKDNAIQVKSGRKRITLTTLDADVYPSYPEAGESEKLNKNAHDIISRVKAVSVACATNDARYMLNGVYIGQDAVATDGHRLAISPLGVDGDAIIPAEAIKKLPDMTGDVFLSKNIIQFKSENMTVKSKLIDATYVDYKRAVRDTDKRSSVNAPDLASAIKAAMITAGGDSSAVTMTINQDSASIKSRSAKNDNSDIGFDAESNDDITMSFNAKYLIDAMSFSDGHIDLLFNDNQIIIESEDIKNVIMTVRV